MPKRVRTRIHRDKSGNHFVVCLFVNLHPTNKTVTRLQQSGSEESSTLWKMEVLAAVTQGVEPEEVRGRRVSDELLQLIGWLTTMEH